MPAHDFSRLSAFDFEELACDLLQAHWNASLEIFTAGRDGGIDLRAFSDSRRETIVQCKHMPNAPFAKLLAHLKKDELPKVRGLAPRRYVLVTSAGLTPANTKALVRLFKPFLKRQSDVYGRSQLNALLRKHKQVEIDNFKLWLTSTAVLQRVLHNAEHTQTQFEVDRVGRKVPLFVQNDAFPRAQNILNNTRILVISGEPGIGKTTLAEMLLFAHLEQGFEPVVIEGGIKEGKRLFTGGKNQIFYFDDFLGDTFLPDRPELFARNQDASLIHFMEAVRNSPASRFILTTREHILQTALYSSEKLRHGLLNDQKCLLELSDYSFGQKARILYNHLYFSDLPTAYKSAVLQSEFYFRIIRHPNFNPRLVEWLSGHARVKAVPSNRYQEHVKKLLDSPEEIWAHAFEHQISEAGRNLLFALTLLRPEAEADILEVPWLALHQHKSRKYNFATTGGDYRRALKELEGSFLKITERKINLANPSVRDFMQNQFRGNFHHGQDVIEAAVRFSQISKLHSINSFRSTEALSSVLEINPVLVETLRSVVSAPEFHVRKLPDGDYEARHVDDSPDDRLRMLIRWAQQTRSLPLLEIVRLAHQHLQSSWGTHSPWIPGLVYVMRMLEDSPWVWSNGGAEIHRSVTDTVLDRLDYARSDDWHSLFAYRANSPHWTPDDDARFMSSYQTFRKKGVYEELSERQERSELELMRSRLLDIQTSYRQVFKNVIKKLNAAIVTREDSPAKATLHYHPVVDTNETGSENEDAVRRLFGSLV